MRTSDVSTECLGTQEIYDLLLSRIVREIFVPSVVALAKTNGADKVVLTSHVLKRSSKKFAPYEPTLSHKSPVFAPIGGVRLKICAQIVQSIAGAGFSIFFLLADFREPQNGMP